MITTTRSVSRWERLQHRSGIFAAVLFLTLLVGSMIVVLSFAHQGKLQTGRPSDTIAPIQKANPTVTPASSPQAQGKTVYSYHTIDNIYSLAWSPNSARIAMGTDTVVREFDATTGKHAFIYNPNPNGGPSILSVAWPPSGQRIADASANVQIWNAKTGKLYITFPSSQKPFAVQQSTSSPYFSSRVNATLFSGGSVVYSTAWSPNGKYMASALDGGYGNIVDVWDTSTGKLITTYHGHTNYVTQVAWSPDGTRIASGGADTTVQIWNASNGKTLYTYHGHANEVRTLTWSSDGKYIASVEDSESGGGTVKVWLASFTIVFCSNRLSYALASAAACSTTCSGF